MREQPLVMVMCGVSGSGKTHYASRLEAQGYVRLSADVIAWERHGSALASMPFARQKEIYAEAFKEVERSVAEYVRRGDKVVVDATMCSRGKRDSMRELCRSLGVEPEFVYMKVPLEVLRERLAGRRGFGPDDQIVPEEMLERFYAGFEAPQPDETVTVISR